MIDKLKLEITLIAVTGVKHGETVSSLKKCMAKVDFVSVKLLTNIDIVVEGIDCINVGGLNSVQDYSKFIIRELYKYFDTSHCLIVQYDSWILSHEAWEDEFLNYDIVGAPGLYIDGRQNLNGGFALRSHYFQKAIANDDLIQIFHPCDEVLCRLYRLHIIEKYKAKYCPDEIAERFSFELREPTKPSFGFHNFHLQPYKPHVVVVRNGAMGDVCLCEPVLYYFHERGYQVVLDTQPEIMNIFYNNPYRIKHISEMNKDIVPDKVINLNMSYESKPKQRVLETYYEFAGIKDGLIRNSKLFVDQPYEHRLFQKYIVFHIDRTNMPYRDVYGVNWGFVGNYYTRLGYTVLTVGKGAHEVVGTYFHAETKQMLMYVLKGADAVCGIDSGICQLAVALERPTAIFFGNVNPKLRYVNFSNIQVIKNACPKPELDFCYHNQESSTTGTKCTIDESNPPCTANYTEFQVIGALNKLLKLN